MHCENNLFMTLIVEVAGNFIMKIEKLPKHEHCNWGWGWEICYKLNINAHKELNLTLNDRVYNRITMHTLKNTLLICLVLLSDRKWRIVLKVKIPGIGNVPSMEKSTVQNE